MDNILDLLDLLLPIMSQSFGIVKASKKIYENCSDNSKTSCTQIDDKSSSGWNLKFFLMMFMDYWGTIRNFYKTNFKSSSVSDSMPMESSIALMFPEVISIIQTYLPVALKSANITMKVTGLIKMLNTILNDNGKSKKKLYCEFALMAGSLILDFLPQGTLPRIAKLVLVKCIDIERIYSIVDELKIKELFSTFISESRENVAVAIYKVKDMGMKAYQATVNAVKSSYSYIRSLFW